MSFETADLTLANAACVVCHSRLIWRVPGIHSFSWTSKRIHISLQPRISPDGHNQNIVRMQNVMHWVLPSLLCVKFWMIAAIQLRIY